MEFRRAQRSKANLRLAITGPAGSGKTYGALIVAKGLGGKIAMIDTENGSGDLYSELCDYDICRIEAPYTVERYIEAIHTAENAGYKIIIIDSLSHEWEGAGGILEQHSQLSQSSRSNNFDAWGKLTPEHRKLIDVILNSKCHIIATIRSKTEYIPVKDENGKTRIMKAGLAPIQRPGTDYEFSIVFDLGANHVAAVSKDRSSIFDGHFFKLNEQVGITLKNWLNVESAANIKTDVHPKEKLTLAERKSIIYRGFLELCNQDRAETQKIIQEYTGGRGSRGWTENDVITLEAVLLKSKQLPKAANI